MNENNRRTYREVMEEVDPEFRIDGFLRTGNAADSFVVVGLRQRGMHLAADTIESMFEWLHGDEYRRALRERR